MTSLSVPTWLLMVASLIALFVSGNAFVADQPLVGVVALSVAVGLLAGAVVLFRRTA